MAAESHTNIFIVTLGRQLIVNVTGNSQSLAKISLPATPMGHNVLVNRSGSSHQNRSDREITGSAVAVTRVGSGPVQDQPETNPAQSVPPDRIVLVGLHHQIALEPVLIGAHRQIVSY